MPDLFVIFRTQSDVEASIVRGLLEANGVPSVITSDVPHNIFPLTVNGLGEVRISVREDCCCLVFESLPVGYTARVNDLLTLPALTTA